MDDPFAVKTDQEKRQEYIGYAWHQEQKRKANDIIRVYNPTEKDYYVSWEQTRHRIPAKSTADVVRYIARTYVRDMTTYLINELGNEKGRELLKKLSKEQPNVLLDKYLENKEVWDKTPRTDDPSLMKHYYDILWVGVVKEFGLDVEDIDVDPRKGEVDFRTTEERLMEDIQYRKIPIEAMDDTASAEGDLIDETIK